jgi:hypothetical protein
MVKVFEDGIRSVLAGVCCAAVVMCWGVSVVAMDIDLKDLKTGERIEGHVVNFAFQYAELAKSEYDYGNIDLWIADGERFICDDFVHRYAKTGVIPEIADGRPELNEWLYGTIATGVFYEWAADIRYTDIKLFFQKMLNVYSPYKEKLANCFEHIVYIVNWLNSES